MALKLVKMEQQYYNEWGLRKIKIDKLNPRHRFNRLIVIKYIKKQKNVKEICEIGCGVGLLSSMLAKRGYHIDGYDIDPKAIELAKKIGHKNVNFYVSDIFKINANGKYDLVCNTSVIEHIEDDVGALKKMYDLLRPGGVAIIGVPISKEHMSECDKKWGHFRRYNRKSLSEKMKQAGFTIIAHRYYEYPLLKWFYYWFYLPAARKRRKIVKKKKIPWYYHLLKIIWPVFYFDFLFNSKKATNVLVIGKKEIKRQVPFS